MPTTTKVPGTKGSRQPVDLFGAVDEAAETINDPDDSSLGWLIGPALFRQSLRGAAGRVIFCPNTGTILDASTVVLVTITTKDGSTARALSPEGWAKVGQGLVDVVERYGEGGSIKVLTERHIRAALRVEKAGS